MARDVGFKGPIKSSGKSIDNSHNRYPAIVSLRYDEQELMRELERLSLPARVGFAAACAARLLPTYRAYAAKTGHRDLDALSAVLERLWKNLAGVPISRDELDGLTDAVLALMPPDDEKSWVIESPAADDAAAAVVYAIATRKSGSVQDAAWAARRTFEAVHEFIVNAEDVDVSDRAADVAVMLHPAVQLELRRQQRDAAELSNGVVTIEELRARAQREGAGLLQAVRR